MQLAIALSEGRKWLGFQCKQIKVLYVNLEIDRASSLHRFAKIYNALKIAPTTDDNLEVWNLRGKAMPLNKLVPKIIRKAKNNNFGAIIIDPIYKVITGDENNASDMGAFSNLFDVICDEKQAHQLFIVIIILKVLKDLKKLWIEHLVQVCLLETLMHN